MWGKNIVGKLLGSDNHVGKLLSGAIGGADALVFTKQEKADRFATVMRLYEPFKIAQRYLALVFSIPYVTAWFITFIASFFINVDRQIELLSGDMGKATMIIVGFYFLGGMASGMLSKNK